MLRKAFNCIFHNYKELTLHTELYGEAKYAYRKAFKDNFRVFKYIVNNTEFSYIQWKNCNYYTYKTFSWVPV